MSTALWIVVADRGGSRLFEYLGRGQGIVLLREQEHVEGRMKDGDFDADRPGRAFDRKGQGRHAHGREVSPSEQAAWEYARRLADELRTARVEGRLSRLVLMAPPAFLGMLRESLDAPTAALVAGTLAKDLCRSPAEEISERLDAVLAS